MSWLRGLVGSLRLRLFGLGDPVPAADDTSSALIQCTHPPRFWTACQYQLGPKGKYGWFLQCTNCGAWFSC